MVISLIDWLLNCAVTRQYHRTGIPEINLIYFAQNSSYTFESVVFCEKLEMTEVFTGGVIF